MCCNKNFTILDSSFFLLFFFWLFCSALSRSRHCCCSNIQFLFYFLCDRKEIEKCRTFKRILEYNEKMNGLRNRTQDENNIHQQNFDWKLLLLLSGMTCTMYFFYCCCFDIFIMNFFSPYFYIIFVVYARDYILMYNQGNAPDY